MDAEPTAGLKSIWISNEWITRDGDELLELW
jgi:hypothetical protein